MLHLETSLEVFWETVTVQRVPLVLWGAGERGEFYNSAAAGGNQPGMLRRLQSAENARKRLFQGSARSRRRRTNGKVRARQHNADG